MVFNEITVTPMLPNASDELAKALFVPLMKAWRRYVPGCGEPRLYVPLADTEYMPAVGTTKNAVPRLPSGLLGSEIHPLMIHCPVEPDRAGDPTTLISADQACIPVPSTAKDGFREIKSGFL
jgi:hypothetical protein